MELKNIVAKLEGIAPSSTAEEWDNVGLLVEPCKSEKVERVFLTNDLTEEVLEEALRLEGKKVGLIVSYHPPLFAPLKRLTQRSFKERILLKAVEAGVAIYSPHTAHDNLTGGVNDWLLSGLGDGEVRPLRVQQLTPRYPHCVTLESGPQKLMSMKDIEEYGQLISTSNPLDTAILTNDRGLCFLLPAIKKKFQDDQIVIKASPKVLSSGSGRILTLSQPISLSIMVERVKQHLQLAHVRLATPHNIKETASHIIKTIAVCAGSGDTVLQAAAADLLIAGEMSHHKVLEAVSKGSSVILCEHSNTERGFLKKFKEILQEALQEEVEISVSLVDKDPLCVV